VPLAAVSISRLAGAFPQQIRLWNSLANPPAEIWSGLTEMSKVCVVVGVGEGGIGDHCAMKFAAEGFRVALLARRMENLEKLQAQIPNSRTYRCDSGKSSDVQAAVEMILRDMGQIDVLVYNAGMGKFDSFDNTSEQDFEQCWRSGPAGLFSFAKHVTKHMVERGSGAIGITGATASWRGMPSTSAFAPAKFALRSLAESLARDFGPKGIHVFHVIIDGIVDQPRTRAWMPTKPDAEFLQPAAIADSYWMLSQQPAGAWTFEMNLVAGNKFNDMLTI